MSISSGKNRHGNLSPEFALLGFLYGESMHGYDLHRKLVTNLGQVWHVSQSQAYAILKRLESHGYIASQATPQEKLPPRQLSHITSFGREQFENWVQTPSGGSARAIRMEFLTRLYFTRQYAPKNTGALFSAQETETKKHIRRLEEILESLPAEQIFNRMSLDMRLRQLKSVLEWLADCHQAFVAE